MKLLAVIPARGGSKRLPGKNIKLLDGRPLIAWTIDAALQSGVFVETIVSTDDPTIADVAQRFGAAVPGLRPAHLATDTAGSVDVVLQVLDDYEALHGAVDGVMLLQPTSPFRTSASIRQAAELFAANGGRALVSVCAAPAHPAWCFQRDGDSLAPFQGWEALTSRSQDLPAAFTLSGSIYVIAPQALRLERRFVGPGVLPMLIEPAFESIDIDTPDDWDMAVFALQRQAASSL